MACVHAATGVETFTESLPCFVRPLRMLEHALEQTLDSWIAIQVFPGQRIGEDFARIQCTANGLTPRARSSTFTP
jgi:hypothetical protein